MHVLTGKGMGFIKLHETVRMLTPEVNIEQLKPSMTCGHQGYDDQNFSRAVLLQPKSYHQISVK
jgi:hypothetical protein